MPCNLKTVDRRVKSTEIWDSETLVIHMGYIWALVSQWPTWISQKTADRRAKWTKIWESGTQVTYIWGTFHLVGFKNIWGSFGALFSKCLVTQKRLAVEPNGL